MIINGNKGKYDLVIGLEVHVQLKTNSKLFSESANRFGDTPNDNVSVVDIAMPGVLPFVNRKAITFATMTGIALNSEINKESSFDRKHYFYPDLPQGYQITQFYHPIIKNGYIEIDNEDGNGTKKISITEAHLEQDAGKLLHDLHPSYSCVDLNRAGVPLLEIVSAPEIESPYEAMEYVKQLRSIVREIGVSDGNMERGSMRCDVNVSLKPMGATELGMRCEVKNVNSIKFIGKAIMYEAARHLEIIESGGSIVQQTRLFDGATGTTKAMRSKEDAMDYRYLPDTDLPEVIITDEEIAKLRENFPELPSQRKGRYVDEFKLSVYDAAILSSDLMIAKYFEKVVALCGKPKAVSNWISVEIFGRIKDDDKTIIAEKVSANQLAELIKLIEDGEVSGKVAKDILDDIWESKESPSEVVKRKGLKQINDESVIASVVREVLASNPSEIVSYKAGKSRVVGFFVGEVMKKTKGQANPRSVNEVLLSELSKIKD